MSLLWDVKVDEQHLMTVSTTLGAHGRPVGQLKVFTQPARLSCPRLVVSFTFLTLCVVDFWNTIHADRFKVIGSSNLGLLNITQTMFPVNVGSAGNHLI